MKAKDLPSGDHEAPVKRAVAGSPVTGVSVPSARDLNVSAVKTIGVRFEA